MACAGWEWAQVDSGDGDDDVALGPDLPGVVVLGSGDDHGAAQGRVVLYGGAGNDMLADGPGDDGLYGGPGDDDIDGGAGDDTIGGGAVNDQVDLGPGRDRFPSSGGVDHVLMRDGEYDSASCGRSGAAVADGGDLVLGCAQVERSDPGRVTLVASPSVRSGRSALVHLLCSSDLRRGCAGKVTARVDTRDAHGGPIVLRERAIAYTV